jgi:hypothetical protein
MKKKVDVFCAAPFVIDRAPFAGKCLNVILDVDTIRLCLLNKAFVWELSKDGKRIPLDFSNYRLDNGGVVEDDLITSIDDRNRKVSQKSVVVEIKDDGTPVIKKEKEVIVSQKEDPKPVIFKETPKQNTESVVIEKKKEEVNKEIKIDTVVEQPVDKEDQDSDILKNDFDKKYDKHNKHNKK